MSTEARVLWLAINLDSAIRRRQALLQQAQHAGIDLNIIPAVAGKDLTQTDLINAGFDIQRRRRDRTSDMTMNEHACLFSHLKALRRFLASDDDFCVVLEDDALLHPRAKEYVQYLTAAPPVWQACKLYTGEGALSPLAPPLSFPPLQFVFPRKLTCSSVAWLYTRKAAQAVLTGFCRYWLPFDTQLGYIFLSDRIPVCGVTPSIITTSDPHNRHSTIAENDERRIQGQLDKTNRTWRQRVAHRLWSWRLSWYKYRMRRLMKRLFRNIQYHNHT